MQELYQQPSRFKRWIQINKAFLIIAAVLVALLTYSAFLLFGNASLYTLLSLRKQQEKLLQEVDLLQKQNAKIQKDIFELKGLEPK
ncbi:hypothetical protein [Helicobacter sp. TUL]|uniref:hypothetical protein n=1 Tax=Helicobacter sp. TUL TaxID=1848928 RepID=UPI0021519022|nr:hypothetical protein [Helicobacter sp. TUL]